MSQSKTAQIIQNLIPNIQENPNLTPSQFMQHYWTQYQSIYESNRNLNGSVFEHLIAISLLRSEISPFYMQAQMLFIPNVNYDIVIYTQEIGPIVLSTKTSIYESYNKQADLEAMALKNVHRKSQTYLISANERETRVRKENLDDVIALDDFVYVFSDEYDALIQNISQYTIIEAPIVPIIPKAEKFISFDNYNESL